MLERCKELSQQYRIHSYNGNHKEKEKSLDLIKHIYKSYLVNDDKLLFLTWLTEKKNAVLSPFDNEYKKRWRTDLVKSLKKSVTTGVVVVPVIQSLIDKDAGIALKLFSAVLGAACGLAGGVTYFQINLFREGKIRSDVDAKKIETTERQMNLHALGWAVLCAAFCYMNGGKEFIPVSFATGFFGKRIFHDDALKLCHEIFRNKQNEIEFNALMDIHYQVKALPLENRQEVIEHSRLVP